MQFLLPLGVALEIIEFLAVKWEIKIIPCLADIVPNGDGEGDGPVTQALGSGIKIHACQLFTVV